MQIYKLQESEIGLTKRLISRVRAVSERSFVGGSFLNLTAIRYDMLDDSRYNKDRCSIFLSFPYFSIKKPELKSNAYSKGAPEHPTRTLLQSRYRLNKTIKRDESQCISNLTGDKLKACIKAPDLDTAHLTRRKVDERVHVAQLWTLIIGLGESITPRVEVKNPQRPDLDNGRELRTLKGSLSRLHCYIRQVSVEAGDKHGFA